MLILNDKIPQAIATAMKNGDILSFEVPTDIHPALQQLTESHRELFSEQLGKTSVISYAIDTGDTNPVKVTGFSTNVTQEDSINIRRQYKANRIIRVRQTQSE